MTQCTSLPQESIVPSDALTDLDADADRATLVEAVTELTEVVASLAEENQRLRDRVSELEETVADLEGRVTNLEDDQADAEEHRQLLAKDMATTNSRLTDVEEAVEDGVSDDEPQGESGENPHSGTGITPETALEDVVALPEHVAEDSLTSNQYRARFLASGVADYTTSVPAGRAITASEMSTVLAAGTDAKGRSATTGRVIGLLNDLGGDEVEVVDGRNGKGRRVVFSEELAARLARLSESRNTSNEVVATSTG